MAISMIVTPTISGRALPNLARCDRRLSRAPTFVSGLQRRALQHVNICCKASASEVSLGGGGTGGGWQGGSGGGGGGGRDDGDEFEKKKLGIFDAFLTGWRQRVRADPQFGFKVFSEVVIGVAACVLGDMASRPNFGLNELDFVFSTVVVGSILNFTLMYSLSASNLTPMTPACFLTFEFELQDS